MAAATSMAMVSKPEATEDLALVRQCLEGDGIAMQRLYNRHAGRIYALGLRLTGSPSDAEDVVQEAFVKAWKNLGRFRGDSAFGTWLFRIATNLCRDLHKRRRPDLLEDANDHSDEEAAPPGDTMARREISKGLSKLSDVQREVLVMHDMLEMEHQEIAAVLDLPLGTSKSHLHRARARMRRALAGMRPPDAIPHHQGATP